MADTFKAQIQASFGWEWKAANDNPADNHRIYYAETLTDGADEHEGEAIWWEEGTELSEGATRTLDLTALTRTIFGDTLTTTLVRLKGILIIVTSEDGQLLVGGAAANEFYYCFGASGDRVYCPADSVLCLTARRCGWMVDASHKNLKLAALDGDVTYSIAILGTLSACMGSCSTSSF